MILSTFNKELYEHGRMKIKMNNGDFLNTLNIRYVDLKFVLSVAEDCRLPMHKTSALRGGMGQMLLRQNCIRDGECEDCDFENECMVRRLMYAKFDIQPRFASRGDSMGYVLQCSNKKEVFREGEKLEFHLLLYGKLIVHFSQFLQAFYMLGQVGLGQERVRYNIIKVENEKGELVVKGDQVYLQRLGIRTIREYVEDRFQYMKKNGCENKISFYTPVSLKYDGKLLEEFHAEAVFRSVLRRIYSFHCFEGIDIPLMEVDEELPEIVHQNVRVEVIPRYSSTMRKKMSLKGIRGDVLFDYLPDSLLLILLAGEKLHIGKNTSFGFGQFVVK